MVPVFSSQAIQCDNGWKPRVTVYDGTHESRTIIGQICLCTTWPTEQAAIAIGDKIINELVNTKVFIY